MALVRSELDDGVRQHVLGHLSLPLDRLVLKALLGSYHEESSGTMEPEELRKEVVRTVKDVVGNGLNRYLLHHLGVMDGSSRYVEKRWHLGFNIVESMDFYPAFLLAELRPADDCKAEFNAGRIEGIDRPTEIEYRRVIQITSEFHHIKCILFEDAAVPILVRLCQVATRHGVPETKELSLAAMRLHRND